MRRWSPYLAILALLAWLFVGCGSTSDGQPRGRVLYPLDASADGILDPLPPTPLALAIVPESLALSVGDRVELSAEVRWSDGRTTNVTGLGTFTSSAPAIVAVSQYGRVAALAYGQARISVATRDFGTAEAHVVVAAPGLASYSVEPASTVLAVGDVAALTATAHFSDGTVRDVTSSSTWASSSPDTVSVDSSGSLRATAGGIATVTGEFAGETRSVMVQVTAEPLVAIEVFATPSTFSVGGNSTLEVRGRHGDGVVRNVTKEASFLVSDPTIAAHVGGSTLEGLAVGTTTVVASVLGLTSEVSITVEAVRVLSVSVSPSPVTLLEGDSLRFAAHALLSNGRTRPLAGEAVWSVADSVVASVDASGTVLALREGATAIRAVYDGQTGEAAVAVRSPTIVSFTLSPNPISVALGQDARVTAIAALDNGTRRDVTSACDLSLSSGAVATLTQGILTPKAIGNTTLTAQYKGRSVVAPVSVVQVGTATLSFVDGASRALGVFPVAGSATVGIEVVNVGSGAATLGGIAGPWLGLAPPFDVGGGTCATGLRLGVGSRCSLEIRVSPTSPGPLADELELSYTGGTASPARIALSGVAVLTSSSVVAAGHHTCAGRFDGTLACWGSNGSGELGLGDTANRGVLESEMGPSLPSVRLGTGRSPRAFAGSLQHSCAILDTGETKCWGANGEGQLGLGDSMARGQRLAEMGDALPSVLLGSGATVHAITLGREHSCALLMTGTTKCWGANGAGQLGLGDTKSRGASALDMGDNLPSVPLGIGRTARSLSAGRAHTCALLDDQSVKCWGANDQGQLGVGDTRNRGGAPEDLGDGLPAVRLGMGRTARIVVASGDHTCAILDSSAVKCWGGNTKGELGLGDTQARGTNPMHMGDSLPGLSLPAGRTPKMLALGALHTCILLDNERPVCFGQGSQGELGNEMGVTVGGSPGTMGDALVPVVLPSGSGVLGLSAGYAHTCALLDSLEVRCWGYNRYGQLGIGDALNRGSEPGQMGDLLPPVAF